MKKMKKVCMILALLAVTFTVMAACSDHRLLGVMVRVVYPRLPCHERCVCQV